MSAGARLGRAQRWILSGLVAFAFTSYLVRTNISVASVRMIPALNLTKVEMGQVFTAFLIGYALFQIVGGALGDRLGARLTLGISALVWSLTTVATGLWPSVVAGRPALIFAGLWVFRLALGLSEATTFPVGNIVVRNWMAPQRRGFGNAVMFLGTSAASAATAPLVSWLMIRVGWQRSFYVTAVPPLALAILWLLLARDHPGAENAERETPRPRLREAAHIFRQRNAILLIASYVSEGYVLFIFVFWLYIYLVERRGFSLLNAGWMAAIPWLTALVITPFGGRLCDSIGWRKGRAFGSRVVITIGYTASGLLLFVAAAVPQRSVAVAALSLSIAGLMAAEAGFWSYAAHLGREHAGLLSGVMNTAGILGGIVSTSLVPVIVRSAGWVPALASGTVMALVCSAIWFFMRDRPFECA